MRAVFDTNVLISAFVVPGSQGERAFLLARESRFDLCTSVAILTETARTLREKFGQDEVDIRDALRARCQYLSVIEHTIRRGVS